MLLIHALEILLVVILLSRPSPDPATETSVLALLPLLNSATLVMLILHKLTTLIEIHPHSSRAMSFNSFFKISQLIQTQPIH